MASAIRIARVVPNVTGLDKEFDYLVPPELGVVVGDLVRIRLQRRNVEGWVVDLMDTSDLPLSKMHKIETRLSCGPSAEVVSLARWASRRWAGRLRPVLVSASPSRRVVRLPSSRRTTGHTCHAEWEALLNAGSPVLVQRGPNADVDALIETIASRGTVLVLSPTLAHAREQASRLRRKGLTVASLPDEWASAAGGIDVVLGARTAVWASVPSLGGVVVVDEHDESLQEERVPTWHAREVAIERARFSGVPCVLVSPLPSASAFAAARNVSWEEGFAWPQIEVVDRSTDERWSQSLISSRLVELVRDRSLRVVVVHNVKGRSQLMACSSCRRLVTCDVCTGPMAADEAGGLVCRRCQQGRPSMCISCGSSTLANLRPGVGRLRDDLLKASGRPPSEVSVVTSSSDPIDQRASLFIGTEAAIHRVQQPDVIVFADIDNELCAPRYRSSEIAGALIISAARKVGSGRIVIQTHSPEHPLLHSLKMGSVRTYVESEANVRQVLGLPPYGALARVTGSGAEVVSKALSGHLLVEVTTSNDSKSSKECLVRTRSIEDLLDALQSISIPKGTRISVDPPRV